MKVAAEWIQEFVDKKLAVSDMVKMLERAGVEVEEVISSKKLDQKIVVGLVKKVVQHPNADKLRLADVGLGGHKTVRVVCGAPNLAEGQHVVLAQVGSILPDGTELKVTDIRGQQSNGMICSQHELGLGDDHTGIMVLGPESKPGTPVNKLYGCGEVIDLTTAANRPDLLSVMGLAREVAAMADAGFKWPKLKPVTAAGKLLQVKVESDKVQRYLMQQFEVDAAHPTADSAQQRLRAAGARPINIVVDITNYVLHELGQPLHAFDADKVKQPITVRMAKKGERLITLDGIERELTVKDLVIADRRGPIALAGVMGGLQTAVTEQTRHILVESATFDAVTVRKTALRLGLRTDASARFERGLSVVAARVGMQRAGDIIAAAMGGRPESKCFDSLKHEPEEREVALRIDRLERLLGMPVSATVAKVSLQRLGFSVTGNGPLVATVPWWRTDVSIEEDLIEDVVRSVGYDALPATLPAWNPNKVNFDRRQAKLWQIKAAMRSLGLFEVVTYSFVSAEQLELVGYDPSSHLKLKNPLSAEQEYLRSSLLPSLLAVVERNSRYSSDFGVFEISRIFDAPADRSNLPEEPTHLAVLRRSSFAGIRDALDLLAREWHLPLLVEAAEVVGLHPARAARISLMGQVVGVLGEVHPAITKSLKVSGAVSFMEVDMDILLPAAGHAVYRPVSRFPSISRDVAVIIADEVTWQDMTQALPEYDIQYLSEYRGDDIPAGSRSLAFRVTFSSDERTLKDAEAQAGVAQILGKLKADFKASPRV